jgi:hypothetical protein
MSTASNNPAAGNAGIASRSAIGRHWPGVPEPERYAQTHVMLSYRSKAIAVFGRAAPAMHSSIGVPCSIAAFEPFAHSGGLSMDSRAFGRLPQDRHRTRIASQCTEPEPRTSVSSVSRNSDAAFAASTLLPAPFGDFGRSLK